MGGITLLEGLAKASVFFRVYYKLAQAPEDQSALEMR